MEQSVLWLRQQLRGVPHIFHAILRMLDYAHFNLLPEPIGPGTSALNLGWPHTCVGFSLTAVQERAAINDCMWNSRGELVVHVNCDTRELWVFA